MPIPFTAIFMYFRMYWKLFIVGALALFIAFLFYCIYSLQQDVNRLKLTNINLDNNNTKLVGINEKNQDTIKHLEEEAKKSSELISDLNDINNKGVSDIKRLMAELQKKKLNPVATVIKDCNCTNIKIIPTEGDFIYETISNIGRL
jgi:predicted RND superfamily exporter protein